MSYVIGMSAIRRQSPEGLAHTEYCSHYALVRTVTGKDHTTDPDAWQIDLLGVTNDGPVNWAQRGRVTDMGHAEFLEGGIDRRDSVYCPFRDVEEVLNFDAVEEYGPSDMDELVQYYENCYRIAQAENPNQIVTGGFYKTIVSGG